MQLSFCTAYKKVSPFARKIFFSKKRFFLMQFEKNFRKLRFLLFHVNFFSQIAIFRFAICSKIACKMRSWLFQCISFFTICQISFGNLLIFLCNLIKLSKKNLGPGDLLLIGESLNESSTHEGCAKDHSLGCQYQGG